MRALINFENEGIPFTTITVEIETKTTSIIKWLKDKLNVKDIQITKGFPDIYLITNASYNPQTSDLTTNYDFKKSLHIGYEILDKLTKEELREKIVKLKKEQGLY